MTAIPVKKLIRLSEAGQIVNFATNPYQIDTDEEQDWPDAPLQPARLVFLREELSL